MGLMTLMVSLVLVGLFILLAIPAILVGLVLGVLLYVAAQVLALPFRLLGWTVGAGAGLIWIMVKLLLVLLVVGFSLIAMLVGFLPLLPVALLFLGLWLIFRRSGSRQAGVA